MTSSVSNGVVTMPTAGAQPSGLPVVAGGGSQVAGGIPTAGSASVANASQPSLVDQALSDVLGTGVVGGGASSAESDPATGIPPFVKQYLGSGSGAGVSQAVEGACPEPAQVLQGRSWIGCAPSHAPSKPPMKSEVSPAVLPSCGFNTARRPPTGDLPPPPSKGDLPAGPPPKGEVPPALPSTPPKAPPTKSKPPVKDKPPIKGDAPGKVDQAPKPRGTHTVGKGESLSTIAPRYGVTWRQLYWANRKQIKHPDVINAGQVLKIPSKDLKVPNFAYKPKFTGPAKPHKPGKHTPAPSKPSKPSKPAQKGEAPSPKETKDTGPEKGGSGSVTKPPGTPSTGGTLPTAPPAPDGGTLPPALPG